MGPSHQDRKPPSDRRRWVKVGAIGLVALALEVLGARLAHEGPLGAAGFTLGALARGALIAVGVLLLACVLRSGRPCAALRRRELQPPGSLAERLARAPDPGAAVREHVADLGAGAFLGFSPGGCWVTADPSTR